MSDRAHNSNLSPKEASTVGGGWHSLKGFKELQADEVAEVFVEGTILVISNNGGKLHAMDGICAHQGGPLGKGNLIGCTLTCPWHGWQYDVSSGRQLLSEVIAQRTYPIRRYQDTIQVSIERLDSATEG